MAKCVSAAVVNGALMVKVLNQPIKDDPNLSSVISSSSFSF